MVIISSFTFKAPWTQSNYTLQSNLQDILSSPFRSIWSKATDCAKQLLSYSSEICLSPLRKQYAYWFVGSARVEPELFSKVESAWERRWSENRGRYSPAKVYLTAPDGKQLPPIPWYRYDNEENRPTIIVLNPFVPTSADKDFQTFPSAMSQECDWLLAEGERRGCNLLFLDARRPVEHFSGHLLDASAACEFLHSRNVTKISVFGFCTGGVVASKVAQMYQARAVTYNAFTGFEMFYRNSTYIYASTKEKISYFPELLLLVTAKLAPLVGWSPTFADDKKNIKSLQHQQDELIPPVAQIPNAILLTQKPEHPLPPHRGHWASLTQCTGADGKLGSEIAFDLLMEENKAG